MNAVLVCTPYFAPGYLAGGSVKTIVNTVLGLQSEIDFWILTQDRYAWSTHSYTSKKNQTWHAFERAQVRYLDPSEQSLLALYRLLKNTPCELLFLNSFFSPTAAIKPLLINWLLHKPVLLAPRGELLPGALALKPWRKKIYLLFFKLLRAGSHIQWLASSPAEARALRDHLGKDIPLHIIADPLLAGGPTALAAFTLEPSSGLRLAFVSRIDRKKNLHYALQILARYPHPLAFDLYGPLDDQAYWQEIEVQIKQLPAHITVHYCGSLEPSEVIPTLAQYHALFIPTLGENFGYIFIEALLAGCPLLISNETPWQSLSEKGLGWDLALDEPQGFVTALEKLQAQTLAIHLVMREKAKAYGEAVQRESQSLVALGVLLKSLCKPT